MPEATEEERDAAREKLRQFGEGISPIVTDSTCGIVRDSRDDQ
jgi:hypothetical protein